MSSSDASAKRLPFVKWYPADYLTERKVVRLTLEEHGAFRLLLDNMWIDSDEQCTFPLDYPQLAAIWRVSEEDAKRILRSLLAPGMALLEIASRRKQPRLFSARLREEATSARAKVQQKVDAGRKGAATRWNPGHSTANGTAVAEVCEPKGIQSQIQKSDTETDQTPVPSGSAGRKREERGSYPEADPGLVIAYYAEKLDRDLTVDEKLSVKRWVHDFGPEACSIGIGYAAQDGFAADFARTYGQIKALHERTAVTT